MKQEVFLGMIPRRHPTLLPENFAVRAKDVDLTRGVLAPLRDDLLVREDAPGGTQAWVSAEGCRVGLPCTASVTEDTVGCGNVFATGVAPYPVRATPGDWAVKYVTRLGLPAPPTPPDVAWGPIALEDNGATARAFIYRYANAFGEEGPASPPSAITTVNWDTTAVVGGFAAPAPEYRATHVVIYALQPGIANAQGTPAAEEAKFFKVGTAPITGGSFSFDGNTKLGTTFDGYEDAEPPADLSDIQCWGADVLAGLSADTLVFSEPDRYGVWPPKYTIQFHAKPLRFLAGQAYGYVLTCGAPEVVTLRHDGSRGGAREVVTIQEELPLAGLRAAALWDGACFYASPQGIVMLAGPQARVISEGLWTQEQWEALLPHDMVFVAHQGFLIASSPTFAFRLKIPSSFHDNTGAPELTELSLRASSFFKRGAELYYVAQDGGLYWWGRGASTKPFEYTTRVVTLPGAVAPAAMKVSTEGPGVHVAVVTGKHPHYTGPAPSNKPFTLPRGVRGDSLQVTLRGSTTITELRVAASFQDLTR